MFGDCPTTGWRKYATYPKNRWKLALVMEVVVRDDVPEPPEKANIPPPCPFVKWVGDRDSDDGGRVRVLDLHAHSSRFRALGLPVVAQDEIDSWEAHADAMRAAAVGKTDEWGFVRDVCGSPTFDKPGTAAEGQAWGVLMEVARAQYLSHSMTAL
ncbi:hypothetical protein NUW54_g5430 [Trametes sanguinea]|uniref:Uncharacterized protein n=1 Tax=Trametes sanguinea TaxID=158606 RepID=A0ACC1PWN7_9APHY|nr:hypothetical protein NUW54_g5430 [Trametes sanguinea]